jgi:hypothetical protein
MLGNFDQLTRLIHESRSCTLDSSGSEYMFLQWTVVNTIMNISMFLF